MTSGRFHFAVVIAKAVLAVPLMVATLVFMVFAAFLVLLPVVYWYGLPAMVTMLLSPVVGLIYPRAGHAMGRWANAKADSFDRADRLINPVFDAICWPMDRLFP